MHQPRRSFKRKPLPNEVGPLWSLRLEHPPAGGRTSVSTASSLGKRTAGGRRYDGELGELTFYRRRRPRGDWFGHPISLSFVSRLAPKHLRSAVIERPTTNRPLLAADRAIGMLLYQYPRGLRSRARGRGEHFSISEQCLQISLLCFGVNEARRANAAFLHLLRCDALLFKDRTTSRL